MLVAVTVSACGGGGGSDNAPGGVSFPPPTNGGVLVTGTASKGPMELSTVNLFPIDDSGNITGPAVVTTTTDANGSFSATIPPGSGALLIRAGGGSYVDEADREPDPALKRRIFLADDEGLEGLLPVGVTSITVSVVTQALVDATRREAPAGLFVEQFGAFRALATNAFGFDVVTTAPANPVSPDPNATVAQRQYALVLGGLANLINRISVEAGFAAPTIESILAASDDLSDGRVDGLMDGAPVLVACFGIEAFSLNDEIARFFFNNFDAYQNTPLITVDENILSQAAVANLAPTAVNDAYLVDVGTTLTVGVSNGVLSNDSDPDGDVLSAVLVAGPANASAFNLAADGSFSYTHDGSALGTDSFTYLATDGADNSSVATVTLTIDVVCDPGAGPEVLKSYDFDGDLSDTLGNGADLVASGGTVDAGRYFFDLNQGLRLTTALPCTTDYAIEIRFQANDNVGGFNKLIDFQDLQNDSGLYVLNGEIDFFSAGPTGFGVVTLNTDTTIGMTHEAGQASIYQDGVLLFTVADPLGQGIPSNNILNFFVDDFPTGQSEAFVGSVDFIRIHRDVSTFTTGTTNTPPVAFADNYALTVGGTITVPAPGVLENDTDADGDTLTAQLIAPTPTNAAAFELFPDGSFTYTHDGSGPGTDNFAYLVDDGTIVSNPALVTLTINPISLTLNGTVRDSLVFAEVVATVDGSAYGGGVTEFGTTAAADGSYSVTIDSVSSEDFVSLRATGAGDDDDIILRSIVGSTQTLLNAGGIDNIVDNTELAAVDLSFLSTTLAVLAEENSVGPIVSDEALAEASAAVDSSTLIRLAASLKTIVETEQIQIGLDTDTISALTNTALRNDIATMLETVFPDDLAAATAQTAADVHAPYGAGEIPGTLYFTAHGNLGSGFVGGEIRFNPAGSGSYAGGSGTTDTTWTIDQNGDISVDFTTPFEFENFVDIGGVQEQQITAFDRVTIQRLIDGARADHVFVLFHETVTYPQNPLIPTEINEDLPGTASARLTVDQTIPFTEVGLLGQGLTATFYHQDNAAVGGTVPEQGFDTLDFNTNGTGTSRRRGFAFTWSINASGFLNVVFSNGDENTFVGVLPEEEGVVNAILLGSPAIDAPFAQRSYAVTRDETQAFDEPSLENRRFRSLGATGGTLDGPGIFPFDFEFFPGGIACRQPGFGGSSDWSWITVNGRMELTRNFSNNPDFKFYRTWQPLRLVDGNRYWVIETLEAGIILTPADASVTPGREAIYRLQQTLDGNVGPTANGDQIFMDAGSTVNILRNELFANDTDPEGDEIFLVANDSVSANGATITQIVDATFTVVGLSYTPPPGFVGTDTFTYQISDQLCNGPAPVSATVSITVELAANTYIVDRTVSGGSIQGTITTNGTIGPLVESDVLSFDLVVDDGTDEFALSSSAGARLTILQFTDPTPSILTATTTELFFNFDFPGGGIVDFQLGSPGPSAWTLSTQGGEQIVHNIGGDVHNQADFNQTGIVPIAGIAVGTGVVFTVSEVGTDVLIQGAAIYDLTGATLLGLATQSGFINPSAGLAVGGPSFTANVEAYSMTVNAGAFGTGGFAGGTTDIGDVFGFDSVTGFITVPTGYTSGQTLSGSTLIAGQSFASLGIIPGVYEYAIPNTTVTLFVGDGGQGTATTYFVDRAVGSAGSVQGTITTNGTMGPLTAADIIAFELTLNDGTDVFTVSSSAGGFIAIDPFGSPEFFTATAAGLVIDFNAAGQNNVSFNTATTPPSGGWAFANAPIIESILHQDPGVFSHTQNNTQLSGAVLIAVAP